MSQFGLLLNTARKRPIVIAALKVALVVGAILNVINQGGRLWDGLPPAWFHVVLNFVVPYCVSSYSAACNEMRKIGEAPRSMPPGRDAAA